MDNIPLQTEEKMRRLLEMQEHPERYTDEEIRRLMADEECRQLYEQMVKAADAVYADMDLAEADGTPVRHRGLSSLRKMAAALVGVLLLSGIAYAAISYVRNNRQTTPTKTENTAAAAPQHEPATTRMAAQDSTKRESVVFEDKELAAMLGEMAAYYGCEVSYRSEAVKKVRLYFTWDKAMDVDDVVAMFNKFERIHITREGRRITVE